ncbi:hypothetical protein [Paraferrimonas sedimenticola]|uniref:Uncharacterized protein n=1 Tax=Paraferrimonas sedimenticola TaxID=375674 RepID=A0AA37W2L4_9GAMM|nr:hypothetical protein [Paraferrimonas sedimenticola]GLP97992.1 hypothetical protein GCM10007895_32990 [Paraferrimonas sedimenticola]
MLGCRSVKGLAFVFIVFNLSGCTVGINSEQSRNLNSLISNKATPQQVVDSLALAHNGQIAETRGIKYVHWLGSFAYRQLEYYKEKLPRHCATLGGVKGKDYWNIELEHLLRQQSLLPEKRGFSTEDTKSFIRRGWRNGGRFEIYALKDILNVDANINSNERKGLHSQYISLMPHFVCLANDSDFPLYVYDVRAIKDKKQGDNIQGISLSILGEAELKAIYKYQLLKAFELGQNIHKREQDRIARKIQQEEEEKAKKKELARIEKLKKASVDLENLANELRWNTRSSANAKLRRGDEVCSYNRNLMGYVEDVSKPNIKVLWKGELVKYADGFFFGNKPISVMKNFNPFDMTWVNSYRYNKIDEITWVKFEEVAACNH